MKRKPWGLLLLMASLTLVSPLSSLLIAQTETDTTVTTDTTATIDTSTTTQTTTEETTTYYEEDDDGDSSDALGCALCGAFVGIPLIIALAINLGIAWWIYRDATRSGNPNAVLWAVLGFLLSLLGLIIYLIVRAQGPSGTTPPASPPPPPPAV